MQIGEEEFYAKESDESGDEESSAPKKLTYIMDPDHRLLLRTCKPLLQSRNAAVSQLGPMTPSRVLLGFRLDHSRIVWSVEAEFPRFQSLHEFDRKE